MDFLHLLNHPFKFRLYMLMKLPSAFFSGVRVQYADDSKAVVKVSYKWFSRNPFGSTYFACLSMAAEMSTGILAMAHTYKSSPAVSLIVIKTEGTYFKKAKGKTVFTCEDGKLVQAAVREAMASGKPQTVSCRSVGINEAGEVVAEFNITWSFKSKG